MRWVVLGLLIASTASAGIDCHCQSLPSTAGETLSGHRIVLADALRNHSTILIAGFSKDVGPACGDWGKAIQADSALSAFAVYQVSMLQQAPSLLRGVIKSGMRKDLSADQQDHFVVLTQDDKLWRDYFAVASDKDPYVVLIASSGQVLWHGHGAAANLEPLLKKALHP
jgi:hypothetical protein